MIIPKDEIIEEIAIPQNRLNPPLAETLAKLNDLLMRIQIPIEFKYNIQTTVLGVIWLNNILTVYEESLGL